MKVGEYRDEKGFKHLHVLLMSVPQEVVQRYRTIFAGAGLTLRALEIETLSLVRSSIAGDQTPTMILDIGSRSTNVIYADRGQLLFSAQNDLGSTVLTQALAQSLNISPLRAGGAQARARRRGVGPVARPRPPPLPDARRDHEQYVPVLRTRSSCS